MRVSSTVERLDVAPGGTGVVPLEVVNTSEVIESLSVRALGVPEASVRVEPDALALFPDAAGEVRLTVGLPGSFPAGTYPVTFVVAGRAPGAREAFHDVDLVVPPNPHVRLDATPTLVRSRSRGAFTLEVRNDGNTPLDVALRAQDADRTVRTTITPSTLAVPAGSVGTATALVKGPRQLLGGDRDRPVTVHAEAPGTQSRVDLVLKQRPTISRGLLTALILLAIVLAWALAFLLGTREVLGAEPYAKVAPASFFAATHEESRTGDEQAAAAAGGGGGAVRPAGAVSKKGPVPAGVGATLTGTVRGQADGQGLGRITVVVVREGRDGPEPVASAATKADGTYAITGLFPGEYVVRVRADGYDAARYPASASGTGADHVEAAAGQVTKGVDLTLTGHPATLSGTVEVGEETPGTEVTVTARPTWGGADAALVRETTADPEGGYTLTDLAAPGTYELTFTAEGYQPTTTTERVLGGQERFALAVRLGAGTGSIAGTVTDGSAGVGGVQVSTSVDGKELVVGTPTVGSVGSFVLPNLPTPATYVLTFTRGGFTTRTLAVDLRPGEVRADLSVVLTGGEGTVTGRAVDEDGAGLGGVTVTAGGAGATASTTTLTSGDVGAFTLTGLGSDKPVTLTFAREGFTSVTVPVTIPASGPAAPVAVTLRPAVGTVVGRVTRDGTGLVGVTVNATDGEVTRTTTTTATGRHRSGSYVLSGLPPATYTVTVVVDDEVVATSIVTVTGGEVRRDLPVEG
ncbi:carboxypeptidase-like regulatory domain-containing protein [Cellulomonas palmilytica]|uniref:carboxypeptidase-like regulatory domain-containing protein n=1 Tax=Cellulomonas palmilytica TaxID=2608402 RepID=UPI001F32D44C|nr:carboxypeptidase-like regulatory domain-containing protein [Cellulomonas palmilytica]UJP41043.1 carboxypeptidase regulatory-like domain-containing protein [Cellulomonas palmilytica]